MSTFPGAQPTSVVAALNGWRRKLRRRPRRCTLIEDNRRCAQHRRSDQRPYGAVSHYRSAHAPGLTTPRRGSMSPRLAADPFLTASKQQRCSASPDNGCRCLPRSAPSTSTPDTTAAIGRARPKPLAVHEAIELLGYTSHSGGTPGRTARRTHHRHRPLLHCPQCPAWRCPSRFVLAQAHVAGTPKVAAW